MEREKIREQAKLLTSTTIDLISKVLHKHDFALLEEMHDQLKARDKKIAILKDVLEKKICWQIKELGEDAANDLLKTLSKI